MRNVLLGTVFVVMALVLAGCASRGRQRCCVIGKPIRTPIPTKVRFFNKTKKPIVLRPRDSIVLSIQYDRQNQQMTADHGVTTDTLAADSDMPAILAAQVDTTIADGYAFLWDPEGYVEVLDFPDFDGTETNIVTTGIRFRIDIEHTSSNTVSLDLPVTFTSGVTGDFNGEIILVVSEATDQNNRIVYTATCYAQFTPSRGTRNHWAEKSTSSPPQ